MGFTETDAKRLGQRPLLVGFISLLSLIAYIAYRLSPAIRIFALRLATWAWALGWSARARGAHHPFTCFDYIFAANRNRSPDKNAERAQRYVRIERHVRRVVPVLYLVSKKADDGRTLTYSRQRQFELVDLRLETHPLPFPLDHDVFLMSLKKSA